MSNNENDRIYKPKNSLSSSSWNKPRGAAAPEQSSLTPETPLVTPDMLQEAVPAVSEKLPEVAETAVEDLTISKPEKVSPLKSPTLSEEREPAWKTKAEEAIRVSLSPNNFIAVVITFGVVLIVAAILMQLIMSMIPSTSDVTAAATEVEEVLSFTIDTLEEYVDLDDVNLVAGAPKTVNADGIQFEERNIVISDIPATFNPIDLGGDIATGVGVVVPDGDVTLLDKTSTPNEIAQYTKLFTENTVSLIDVKNHKLSSNITIAIKKVGGEFTINMTTLLPVNYDAE